MAGRDRSRHKQLNPECSGLGQMEDLELGSESLPGEWMGRSFPGRENGMGNSLRDPEECDWCGQKEEGRVGEGRNGEWKQCGRSQ